MHQKHLIKLFTAVLVVIQLPSGAPGAQGPRGGTRGAQDYPSPCSRCSLGLIVKQLGLSDCTQGKSREVINQIASSEVETCSYYHDTHPVYLLT